MGFGAKWISWIHWCISIVSFFVPYQQNSLWFLPKLLGLKAGGSSIPYFFVIVMGALSCLLNKVGVLSAWQFNGRGGVGVGVEISQLLFAYDTLVFSHSDGGLENVGEMTHEFGCKLSALPSSYLGLPLGTRFKDVEIWDGVEERLWKRPYISKGGLLEASYWWEEYGEEKDGWRSCEVRERFGVDLLKAIRREWDMVDGNMVFSMGNERKVRFW
ncbi:hypothetical protein CK203_019953 [Vitis vinifera]|uniref:Reverse transcriptase domain-containing protein n=1 Tax=Vitis vinifera TaxID=29760 RepID=A0A438J379_VITVI|nr:hypothetical protein CK203_019953 [Vitis vinifera]